MTYSEHMHEVTQAVWDAFVIAAPGGSFLQSWAWGELQRERHLPYWRLTTGIGRELTGVALVIRRELPAGHSWLYVPRGPVVRDAAAGLSLFKQLAGLAEQERAAFVRIEPPVPGGGENSMLVLTNWQKSEVDVQPRHTLRLDLGLSEEELLAQMHHKTRYNIRLGERRRVQVEFEQTCVSVDSFVRLSGDVSARQPFHYHPPDYYEALCRVLGTAKMLELAVARFETEVLAVLWLVSFGDTVTYVHGASSSQQRGLMAPQVLQWASIQRARARGARWYDFFGVAPHDASADHAWAGITRFKEGFGGQRVTYLGAHDLVLDRAWYWLYRTARMARSRLL